MSSILAVSSTPRTKARRQRRLVARLATLALTALALTTGLTIKDQQGAEALTGGCSWTTICTYHLNPWETRALATGIGAIPGIGSTARAALYAFGAQSAADAATSNGKCLSIRYSAAYMWAMTYWPRRC